MSVHWETVRIIETGRKGHGIEAVEIDSNSSLRGVEIPVEEWRSIVEHYAEIFAASAGRSDWYAIDWEKPAKPPEP